ncbi:MAG: HEAT repeat domain-containing protein [Gaiellaceae bacterium]
MAIAFLADAGIMVAQSAIDALFFARYGVGKLPLMYALVGVAMFGTTLGVAALLARAGRPRAFLLIFVVVLAGALGSRAALESGASWIYAALWLVRNIAQSTLILAVWGLAGLVADTRQAKRYFPVIAAGGVMGLVVGGVATAPLAATLGSANLLLVWAVLIAGAAVLAWRLVHTEGISLATARARTRGSGSDLTGGLTDVVRSGLLRWMSVANLLVALLFSLLYLAFSRVAVERYEDPDKLAAFFGVFFAIAMAAAFVISLLVTSRLLARFGVPTVVLVLPLLYVVGFGVAIVTATFAVLVAFRFAQVAWDNGGANGTWEALINSFPADRRDRARAFLYGVPLQLGTILAGLVAFIAQRLGHPDILYGAGLVAAILAVASVMQIRGAYPRALVAALREGRPAIFGAPQGPRPAVLNADATSRAVLEGLVNDGDPAVRRLAVFALGDFEQTHADAALLRALEDTSPHVRAEALESLDRLHSSAAMQAARRCLSDPDSTVRRAALGVLIHSGALPEKALLHDDDPSVRAQAASLLLGHDGDARQALLRGARDGSSDVRAATLRGIAAARIAETHSIALEALADPDAEVRAQALRAIAATASDNAVASLIGAFADDDPRVRAAAVDGLAEIGASASAAVSDALFDKRRAEALAALERIPLDGAAGRVRRFASEAVTRALADARLRDALGPPGGDAVDLLRRSLTARAERNAIDALRAAALLGDRATVSAAIENLTVSDPAQRANAVEVIETVGESAVVRPLLALLEPPRIHERDPHVLEQLRADDDEWIRACAEFASHELEGVVMTRTETTVPLVERVVLLRKAPLFAALPPQDLQPIAEVAEEHVFMQGDVIAAEGEPGETTYVIVEGEVDVVADGRTLAVRGSGDVIGEMSVISSRPRVASLRAKSDVRVLEIRKPAFQAILRERPDTALALMRVLCERLAPHDPATT